MYRKALQLLNIKPAEAAVVKELFTIQFFLGVATAFLFTSSLTMFLSNYEIKILPVSYILSACLLLVFNRIYSYAEGKLHPPKLLQAVILFSAMSILVFWVLLTVLPFKQLPLIIAGWYMLIYMLVGYAFWGMASVIFNVRESKRLFSIVGAGDIPAKMLGYFSVSAMASFIKANNFLWVSVISFLVAWFFLKKFEKKGLLAEPEPHSSSHLHDGAHEHSIHTSGFITKFFDNRLVLSIALLSLLSYIVFAFIDFTFLSDIKVKYSHEGELATFIAVFFAAGRFLAVGIKILFSSRMISRIGLTNALLVTPVLLLLIDVLIIVFGNRFISSLYIFGFMVLLTEILRSTLQEPVFFILFQPLKPHDRLRGHLVAKGHTLPFALIGVGGFLLLFFRNNTELPILLVGEILVALLLLWIAAVYIIKKEYLQTLITSLKKGFFSGAELFLNDEAVTNILLAKTESKKPREVIHSLNLLERSEYQDIYTLLLKNLQSPVTEIKEYVVSRIIANNMTSALPLIKQQLEKNIDENLRSALIKAFYFLNKETGTNEEMFLSALYPQQRKAAMEGLLLRKEERTEKLVTDHLLTMSKSSFADKMLALDIIADCGCENYTRALDILLADNEPQVYKKAIVATGKVKDFALFAKVVYVTEQKGARHSFRRAVLSYGDALFAEENWQNILLSNPLLEVVIKTAGNIKGENSTAFVTELLKNKSIYTDLVIEALWLKKAKPAAEINNLIEDWANEKNEQTKHKVSYYFEVLNHRNLVLLQQAMMMEIRKDAQVLLKGFSLLYDREKVDRVIELLSLGNTDKISNAVEILELIIPKKYFAQLNTMVELIDDVGHKKEILTRRSGVQANTIIEEVIKDNKANFTEWTRSVACYMIPKLKKDDVSLKMLDAKEPKENHLFNETRNYVLSMLN